MKKISLAIAFSLLPLCNQKLNNLSSVMVFHKNSKQTKKTDEIKLRDNKKAINNEKYEQNIFDKQTQKRDIYKSNKQVLMDIHKNTIIYLKSSNIFTYSISYKTWVSKTDGSSSLKKKIAVIHNKHKTISINVAFIFISDLSVHVGLVGQKDTKITLNNSSVLANLVKSKFKDNKNPKFIINVNGQITNPNFNFKYFNNSAKSSKKSNSGGITVGSFNVESSSSWWNHNDWWTGLLITVLMMVIMVAISLKIFYRTKSLIHSLLSNAFSDNSVSSNPHNLEMEMENMSEIPTGNRNGRIIETHEQESAASQIIVGNSNNSILTTEELPKVGTSQHSDLESSKDYSANSKRDTANDEVNPKGKEASPQVHENSEGTIVQTDQQKAKDMAARKLKVRDDSYLSTWRKAKANYLDSSSLTTNTGLQKYWFIPDDENNDFWNNVDLTGYIMKRRFVFYRIEDYQEYSTYITNGNAPNNYSSPYLVKTPTYYLEIMFVKEDIPITNNHTYNAHNPKSIYNPANIEIYQHKLETVENIDKLNSYNEEYNGPRLDDGSPMYLAPNGHFLQPDSYRWVMWPNPNIDKIEYMLVPKTEEIYTVHDEEFFTTWRRAKENPNREIFDALSDQEKIGRGHDANFIYKSAELQKSYYVPADELPEFWNEIVFPRRPNHYGLVINKRYIFKNNFVRNPYASNDYNGAFDPVYEKQVKDEPFHLEIMFTKGIRCIGDAGFTYGALHSSSIEGLDDIVAEKPANKSPYSLRSLSRLATGNFYGPELFKFLWGLEEYAADAKLKSLVISKRFVNGDIMVPYFIPYWDVQPTYNNGSPEGRFWQFHNPQDKFLGENKVWSIKSRRPEYDRYLRPTQ